MLNLQSIYFGQKNKDFDYQDFDVIKKIARLAHKHQRQCENDCNGEGWVKGEFFRCDGSMAGSYVNGGETTIFYVEIIKIEEKIRKLLTKGFVVEFQRDPRGNTVKLSYNGSYVEL